MVALGGGHGLSASLRAVRRYAGTVTAIVSVADDGGSSGALRARMPDLPAPGDVRRCLGALSEEGSPFGRVLEHRFGEGDLEGHALGNLLLVALSQEMGSFAAAVDEVALRVGAVGRVLPATIGPVDLRGWHDQPGAADAPIAHVDGQVAVQNASGVFEVSLEPAAPTSSPEVAEAILAADQVVIGPGSLFTSVLAAAIVPAVRDALRATSAQRAYVANLGPQEPETSGFSVADEVAALARHGVPVDVIVADPARDLGDLHALGLRVPVASLPVAATTGAVHDPALLAAALAGLLA
ncbi:uridine diphosphate-N-acetylglucosamine-binding protein YvcK [Aquihabitans daechungensis]|uniref:gluconeogenesis factor YvcK family protein n=1 Tax=Aquihabitans daechungensis TaxID=1052257 RepID=UPI003BA1B972